VGRAFVISWPVTRWTYLSNYPDTFAGVGKGSG
jgi:signal peptidase I